MNKIKLTIIISIGVLFISMLVGSAYLRSISENTIIDGIKIGELDLSNLSYDLAINNLESEINIIMAEEVTLVFKGEAYKTSLTNLGVKIDTYQTLEKVYETSTGRNILNHLKTRIVGLTQEIQVEPVFSIDMVKLEAEIKRLIPSIKEANEASIIVAEDLTVMILPHENGIRTNFNNIYSQLHSNLLELKLQTINIPDEEVLAVYKDENATEDAQIITALLNKELIFIDDNQNERTYEKMVKVQRDWFEVKYSEISFNKGNIVNFITNSIANDLNINRTDVIIKSIPEEGSDYAVVEGLAKDGRVLSINNTLEQILFAIENDKNEIYLKIDLNKAMVLNETGIDLGEMVLLGQGKSNFAGSPEGRAFNIAKGLNEKFNNILLKPGQSFSYNSYLGPVTYGNGWKASLAIFGGSELIPVPGGGLCQVSTTMYRALVYSGLKVLQKSNHSLYVHYYKKYGDGLDAAIYPGSKDLRFENDTDSYILLQAYVDGDDAYINIYGTPDGRKVELIGPIYANKLPEGYSGDVRSAWNQIKWIQKITRSNGEVEENVLTSTYRTAPR